MKIKTQSAITKISNFSNILSELWERNIDQFSKAELEWFAEASTGALMMLQNLEEVVDGIGCYVAGDASSSISVGYFDTTENTSTLLFCIAESMRSIRAVIKVSDEANYRLRYPNRNQG